MKRLSITIVIFFMVFAMACKKSSEIITREGPGSNSGTSQSVPAQSSLASAIPVANPTEAAPPMASEFEMAPAMNPPHGQPNHRCDIAVGAPLDSPPGNQPPPPFASQANVPVQTTTAPSTAPGLNPPHGQPNHRCDIAVGVPLDSPPATKPAAPVVSGQNIPLQTATSPIPTATTPTAPGMNPPHGQPNHRCDIAVGVPLDSPPGTGKQQTPNTTGASPSTSSPPIKIVPAPK